jgi:putative pyruvate formate lyase activating enzyme
MGGDLTIRHLVMPNHVECCTYPVLDWTAELIPDVQVNVMDQYRPDNFCDPHSAKYRSQYAEIARRPKRSEIRDAYRHAERLGLKYETVTFERFSPEHFARMPGI